MGFFSWFFGYKEPEPARAEGQSVSVELRPHSQGHRYRYVSELHRSRIEAAARMVEHYGRLQALGKSKAEQQLYDNAVAFLTMHLATKQ